MISYMIYSTICMGLVLLFYHALLAREKIYQINRWYLLGALLFSLIIPFMPIGVSDSLLTLGNNTEISQILSSGIENTNSESVLQVWGIPTEKKSVSSTSYFEWITPFLFYFYGIVTLILFFRMIRHLYRMKLKSMKYPGTAFKGYKVVLVDEDIVPHTFWKTIFVNREQYENNEISKEVLTHELFHAKQNHTFDILIIELLKTIFWFNPVLYFYKKAVEVNHEFIADEKVLSNGGDIANYQNLLLEMRTAESPPCLSSSLNYNITKKRFKMMTLNSSKYRSYFKLVLIIPFFVILGITFGCEPAGIEQNSEAEKINLELIDTEEIKLNGKTVSASEFGTAFTNMQLGPKHTLINLKVHKNVPMGLVTDVQKVLRESGALKINYSAVQSNKTQPNEDWRSQLKRRNILDLYINKEGEIIVNQDVTSLSALNEVVINFITNNGESPSLSESPENAIIAIKTDKKTPHDTYMSAIDKIMGAYNELRNQASMELFDKSYKELEEGSKESNKIKTMFPKRISINDPSRS